MAKFWRSYFGGGKRADFDSVRNSLWTAGVDSSSFGGDDVKYRETILAQYNVCLEMADRISARRGLANTFYLTLNTAIFALIGGAWKNLPKAPLDLLIAPLVVLVIQCMTWFWLVRSYRQLNAAKYLVVGALEERLPASPYWKAEWVALGEGDDKEVYWPLTHIEQWVPPLFALAYVGGFIAIVLS
ncbi:hypothetical protein I7331_26155 [Frankia sp. AgB1.8]|nr:hypothetical protein [Frankia sp. AgB1.8]